MAVYGSPFRAGAPRPQAPEPPKDDAARKQEEYKNAVAAAEKAVARIKASGTMSADEKERAIDQVYKLLNEGYPVGKSPTQDTGWWGRVKKGAKQAVGGVIAPFAPDPIKEKIYDYTLGLVPRAGSAVIEEIAQTQVARGRSPYRPFVPPVARLGAQAAGKAIEVTRGESDLTRRLQGELTQREKDIFAAVSAIEKEPITGSIKDVVKKTMDPSYNFRESAINKAVAKINPFLGFATELGVSIAVDPMTYVTGVGNVKYVGRAGKLALAQRFATKEMTTKYPQLLGRYNDIVRYGQHAPIEGFAEILKGEGIETGVRILGQVVRGTDQIAAPVGRQMSASWEKVMDIATKVGRETLGASLSPRSRAFMQDVGRRTAGKYRLTEEDALKNIANWSARQFSRGQTPYQFNRFYSQIQDTLREAREAGLEDQIADLAERANPYSFSGGVAFSRLDETQQRLVRNYVDWQRGVYADTESVYKKFGVDFGSDVPDFSWIDNYVFHKMSREATDWFAKNEGLARGRGWFRDADLDAADITDVSAPLRYRKLRAPQVLPDGTIKYETFMGEQVREGTIKELNEIFRRVSGADINFFETNIDSIAQSYAYSMAKMRGREAYVRRLIEYGDAAAAPLLYKTIPDPRLAAESKKVLDDAIKARDSVRARMGRRMVGIREVVKRGIKDAEDIINGNLRQTQMNQRATDATIERLTKLEDALKNLRQQAANLEAHKRGEFDVVHAALLTDITNLRNALANGTAELDEIRLGLQTTYRTMYPNAVKVPDDIDVLADRIVAARGVPAAREVREINVRLAEIRTQLDSLAVGSPEYQQLADEMARLKDVDNGFRVMAEYRAAQDYAPDNGFLYITGREMAETDEMQIPFKTLRTSASGFPDKADVLGVRVFGNDEILDFRTPRGISQVFGRNDFGDGLVDQLRMLGVDTEPLETGLDMIRATMPIDPEFEQAFPELADLLKLMEGNTSRDILATGDPNLVKQIYEENVDLITGLLVRLGTPNADQVARQIVDGALGYVAKVADETNTGRGIVLPANLFDDAAEVDDVVVILAPRVVLEPTKSVTGSVQDASSPLIDALMRTDAESALGAARGRLNQVASRKAEIDDTVTALKQEMSRLQSRKGGLKSATTKRKNAAALAKEKAGEARNLPREIVLGGKPRQMTLGEIDKNLNALTASEARLRANMERTLVRERAALKEGGLTLRGTEAKLAQNQERLRVLFDEASALLAWDYGTGMMVRDEIATAIDAIASMPPTGLGIEASRNWIAGVQRAVNSGNLIQDPSLRTAYERLMRLSAFDEWNLATAEEGLAFAKSEYDAIMSGKLGGLLAKAEDRVFEGWEAIAGLGVQIPKEVLDVWKPNIQKILAKQNRGAVLKGLGYLNRFFKTYAIGTVGYVVRNLYSALFMNAVAGVSADAMEQGWKAMWYYNKYGAGRWLDEMGLTGLERTQFEQAMKAVEASGRRGLFTELAEPVTRGTRREKILATLIDNPYTKALRASNTRVEDAVRFPLALQSIRNGDDYVGASQLVTRYHFNYEDLSDIDEFALKFIPFWIWTTRNLPNQLANQWMRPQVYSFWENVQESLPTDDTILMPNWQREYEPLSLARFGRPDILIRPDLPHQRLIKSIQQFTTPSKLVGSAYPIYKLPIEFMAERNLALGIPFRDEPRKAEGFDRIVAELVGVTPMENRWAPEVRVSADQSERMITEFPSYAAGNLFPLIAQLQRITGGELGGKESYKDRQLAAISTFFGLPLDFVTERMQGSEAVGRKFNINDYTDLLKRLGLIQGAEEFNKQEGMPSRIAKRKNIERRAEERATAKQESETEAARVARQKASDNAKLQVAEKKYGKDSKEYKAVKDEIAARKKREREQASKERRAAEVEENPIKMSGDE
jgi:hypothetical protein